MLRITRLNRPFEPRPAFVVQYLAHGLEVGFVVDLSFFVVVVAGGEEQEDGVELTLK